MLGTLLNPSGAGTGLRPLPLHQDSGTTPPVVVPSAPTIRKCQHLEANAILLFSQQSSQAETDHYTGNITQQVISGEPVRVECAIREQKRQARDEKSEGLEFNQSLMRGYILSDPAALRTFDVSAQLPIEINSPVEGGVIRGLINLDITINPHSRRINQVSGIPFTGIMSRVGSGETSEYPV